MKFTYKSKATVFLIVAVSSFFTYNVQGIDTGLAAVWAFGGLFLAPMFWDERDTSFDTIDGLIAVILQSFAPLYVSGWAIVAGMVPRFILDEAL